MTRKTDRDTSEEVKQIRRFWRHTFGNQHGYLCIMSADRDGKDLLNVEHEYFSYPAESADAAEHSLDESGRGREAYYAVHLMKDRTHRRKENAQDIVWLWADLDGAPIPEEPKPTSVLESSPGRYQIGWRLSEPIAADRAEALCRRLTYSIGADKGKWALSTVLRAPHTTNHKRDEPWKVQIVRLDGGAKYDCHELEQLLAPQESTNGHSKDEHDTDEPPVRLRPWQLRIWTGQAPKLRDDGEIDRSGSLFKIGGMLARAGLTKHTITLALRARDEALGYRKYTGRADDAQYAAIAEKVIEEAVQTPHADAGDPQPRSVATNNAPGAKLGREPKQDPPTDDELRDRYLDACPDYAYGLGKWRHYRDGIWHEVEDFQIQRGICRIMEDAKQEKIRPNQRLLSSIETLTRVRVSVPSSRWDADPDILVCTNGALNLATRELMDHSMAHFATAGVPFAFDENARSEAWERVLDEVVRAHLEDEGVLFLQEFAGYCLTPRTEHEISLWLTGPHGGGRSTILAGLGAMLGPKCGVLSLADIERSSFALSNLPGKTLVTATEQPQAYLRGGGTLNAIISGEPVQIDRKYRDPLEVTPRCKIAWAMNELPRVGNNDDGIFRRVKIMEFPEIPEDERDPAVKEAVKHSGAAILNWSLDGLERLNNRGHFEVPEMIRSATEDFKETNDVPAMFVDEACEKDKDVSEAGGRLYECYKMWCLSNGHKPLASNNAAREWRRLGFKKKHTEKGARWRGVRITDDAYVRYVDTRGGY